MREYQITTKRLGMSFIKKEDSKYLEHICISKNSVAMPESELTNQEISNPSDKSLFHCQNDSFPCLVISRLTNNDFVGEAYFNQIDTGEIKVGYLFNKKYWNKGYAPEVLKALLDWAKNNINSDYIIAYAGKENTSSFRVMEKCGMEYYRNGKHKDMECHFYRIKNQ